MNDFSKQIKLTDKVIDELNNLYRSANVSSNCNHVSFLLVLIYLIIF